MERYLTHIGKVLSRLAVSHAVTVGSRQVTAELKFVIVRTAEKSFFNCRYASQPRGCSKLLNLKVHTHANKIPSVTIALS